LRAGTIILFSPDALERALVKRAIKGEQGRQGDGNG